MRQVPMNCTLDVKTFPNVSSLGMAQGSTKKSRNKKMAYTHNDAMTSAHNTIQYLYGDQDHINKETCLVDHSGCEPLNSFNLLQVELC